MPRAMGIDNHKKNQLRKLRAEGYSVEEVGLMLSVADEVVQNWFDYFDEQEKGNKKEK